jgi:hypothetical protein
VAIYEYQRKRIDDAGPDKKHEESKVQAYNSLTPAHHKVDNTAAILQLEETGLKLTTYLGSLETALGAQGEHSLQRVYENIELESAAQKSTAYIAKLPHNIVCNRYPDVHRTLLITAAFAFTCLLAYCNMLNLSILLFYQIGCVVNTLF